MKGYNTRRDKLQKDAYERAMAGKTPCPRSVGDKGDCKRCGSRGEGADATAKGGWRAPGPCKGAPA